MKVKNMLIYSNNDKKLVKKVNPYLIKEHDGNVISWPEQLELITYGILPPDLPLVVTPNINEENIPGISNKPIFIYYSTIISKISKHNLPEELFKDLDKYINNWVIGFDSLKHNTSKIFVLEQKDNTKNNIIYIIRENAQSGVNTINIISSVHSRNNLSNLISRTFESGKEIYINPKQIDKISNLKIELPLELIDKINNTLSQEKSKHKQLDNDFGLGM